MGDSKIEWTQKTWNPIRGCSVVSEGCRNCYAMNFATRFVGKDEPYEGLAYRNESGAHWTGQVKFVEEHLVDPLRWRDPHMVFVNSMSDLFHEAITDQQITDIFGVMALAHWHTFQVLTKRPRRMLDYLKAGDHGIIDQFKAIQYGGGIGPRLMFKALDRKTRDRIEWRWPLPNVWLGVSAEDQKTADERIPLLLQTPAAVRWISAEPLLGSIDLRNLKGGTFNALDGIDYENIGDIRDAGILGKNEIEGLDWVVVGGESGPKARPMHPDWARALRDQCVAACVPYFFKQWGEWSPISVKEHTAEYSKAVRTDDWREVHKQRLLNFPTGEYSDEPLTIDATPYMGRAYVKRLGKKASGRKLDGREWSEYPKAAA